MFEHLDPKDIDRRRCSGFYRGTVIQRSSNRSGRLKIWIPGVYDESWIDQPSKLPDAEPASPLFAGCLNGNGMFSYPNIGSTVWCFFQNEDQNLPVYFAATYAGTDPAGQFAACEPLPDNDTGAYIHKIVCGKTTILLSETGNLILETRTVDPSGVPKQVKFTMDQSGNLNINAGTSIDISTQDLRIVASNRMEIITPDIEIKTNAVGKNKNDNKMVVQTDSFLLDAGNGTTTVINRQNGTHLI